MRNAAERPSDSMGDMVKLHEARQALATPVGLYTTTPAKEIVMLAHDTDVPPGCAECGKTLLYRRRGGPKKYCSTECRKVRDRRVYTSASPLPIIACARCSTEFQPRNRAHKHCSPRCTQAAYQDRAFPETIPHSVMPPGTIGAIAELRACADLMSRGYHVFRALSPHCPCDLVVWVPGGRVIRVEVKTASINRMTGYARVPLGASNEFDVICSVSRNEVIYYPPIEEW